nr:hypothetical protein [Tanacetum cinerariifolium]
MKGGEEEKERGTGRGKGNRNYSSAPLDALVRNCNESDSTLSSFLMMAIRRKFVLFFVVVGFEFVLLSLPFSGKGTVVTFYIFDVADGVLHYYYTKRERGGEGERERGKRRRGGGEKEGGREREGGRKREREREVERIMKGERGEEEREGGRAGDLTFSAASSLAISENMTWRHHKSYVLDDFPTDGFDQTDVSRLCDRCAKLHNIKEVFLVRSGLSTNCPTESVIQYLENIMIVLENPRQFNNSILKRVDNHTTPPTAVGTPLPEPTPEDIVARHRKVLKKV